jgi:Flp pilus assembly pilin Flp
MRPTFSRDTSGQGLVEYALVIALVAVALISILVLFRNATGNAFNQSRNRINEAGTSSYSVTSTESGSGSGSETPSGEAFGPGGQGKGQGKGGDKGVGPGR